MIGSSSPSTSITVRDTWESAGMCSSSSSTLSAFVRPIARSGTAVGSASQRAVSCGQSWTSSTVLPAPGASLGVTTTLGPCIGSGFSVPSMNPVRSRSW